jgi:hypothetical protein
MSNNKQSSVEYAVNKLEKLIPPGNQMIIRIILEQAKAMHKEEIKDAWDMGEYMGMYFPQYVQDTEQYYNETYGGNNE